MRTLTQKQKKLLDVWYEKNKNYIQTGINSFNWEDCKYFPIELYDALEKINNSEILSQEINRYISDKGMSTIKEQYLRKLIKEEIKNILSGKIKIR